MLWGLHEPLGVKETALQRHLNHDTTINGHQSAQDLWWPKKPCFWLAK